MHQMAEIVSLIVGLLSDRASFPHEKAPNMHILQLSLAIALISLVPCLRWLI
jgi:hypothetical protein